MTALCVADVLVKALPSVCTKTLPHLHSLTCGDGIFLFVFVISVSAENGSKFELSKLWRCFYGWSLECVDPPWPRPVLIVCAFELPLQ